MIVSAPRIPELLLEQVLDAVSRLNALCDVSAVSDHDDLPVIDVDATAVGARVGREAPDRQERRDAAVELAIGGARRTRGLLAGGDRRARGLLAGVGEAILVDVLAVHDVSVALDQEDFVERVERGVLAGVGV